MIPNAIAAWNVIITRTYYQSTIPDELHEAAQLDGCSDVRFLMSDELYPLQIISCSRS